MRKNKTIAYLMAACLLVGGTFLGTKAWFFSNKAAVNDLVITTGSMDISVSQDANWMTKNTNGNTVVWDENKNTEGGKHAYHVQPGNSFIKTITITNTGNLPQKISVGELQPLVSLQTIKDILLPKAGELATSLQAQIKEPIVEELKDKLGDIAYVNTLISMLDDFNFVNVATNALNKLEVDEMLTYSVDRSELASELAVGQSTTFNIEANITEDYGITGDEKEAFAEAMKTELLRVMEGKVAQDSETGKLLIYGLDLAMRTIDNPIESIMSDIFENKQLEFKYLCEPIKVEATQVTYNE